MTTDTQGFTMNEVEVLRRSYKPEGLLAATRGTLAKAYPPGAAYVGSLVDALYGPEPVAPRDRERSLIALLAARQEQRNLAIHIYWGLMEGLTLDEVCHTLLLAGAYTGIPCYATAILIHQKTCGILQKIAAGPVEGHAPLAIGGKLIEAFAN
jgi:alkylhydroperoxidase/carboxymuconolactone decarboxylase family protein YurZ